MFIVTKTLKGRPVSINTDHVVKFKPAQYVEQGKAIAFYSNGTYDILEIDYERVEQMITQSRIRT